MIIKRQKPIEFNSPTNVLFDRKDLAKAIIWYSTKPVARVKRVFRHGQYYAVSIYDQKIHIHRLLAMYYAKRDIELCECVHHIDGNIFNNLRENLTIMLLSDHQSLHNKGKKLTKQHRQKISVANRRRKGVKQKKRLELPTKEIIERYQYGESILSLAKLYGCSWSTIKSRIHDNPNLLEKQK